jgi:hypothetical protein
MLRFLRQRNLRGRARLPRFTGTGCGNALPKAQEAHRPTQKYRNPWLSIGSRS